MSAISHDAITLAVIALLTAALPSDRIEGDVDFDALRTSETRAVEVQLVRSLAQYPYAGDTSPREWTTQLRIACGARADTLAPINGRASHTLLGLVDAALMADPLLGGLLTRALQLEEIRPGLDRGETALGVVAALYSCEHQTDWDSLTT
jgi:hypothetical protein